MGYALGGNVSKNRGETTVMAKMQFSSSHFRVALEHDLKNGCISNTTFGMLKLRAWKLQIQVKLV